MLLRALVLTWLGAAAGCAVAPPNRGTPARLPATSLVTLDGAPMRLGELAAGRVALVSLWATWCAACLDEIEPLMRLAERAKPGGHVVVGVAVGEPRGVVAAFVRRRGLSFPQLVDERFAFADALGRTRVPTTLVVDGGGRVRFIGGAFDAAALAALERTLDEQ